MIFFDHALPSPPPAAAAARFCLQCWNKKTQKNSLYMPNMYSAFPIHTRPNIFFKNDKKLGERGPRYYWLYHDFAEKTSFATFFVKSNCCCNLLSTINRFFLLNHVEWRVLPGLLPAPSPLFKPLEQLNFDIFAPGRGRIGRSPRW